MRITCPFCGERDLGEFTYLGDAAPQRPLGASGVPGPELEEAFYDYVYLRDNPAGLLREHWYHGGGCRAWLIATRDTRSHAFQAVEAAPGAGASPDGGAR
ncbi:MAG: sarcosine oxidase subunit delta [Mesorhizobium sp.]|jgi:methylglutamate dehydrogenase subunit B